MIHRLAIPPTLRLAAFCALVAASLTIGAARAEADTPSTVGWWTTANPATPPVPAPAVVPSSGGPDGTPSDVPTGGLEVSNLPGDTSIAAIGYFAYGQSVTKVVLHQTPNAAAVQGTKLQACPLTGSGTFTPVYGAPASEEPAYSCRLSSPGVADASAGTVTFEVANLIQNDYLGIAIVVVGNGRIVFNPPGPDTIAAAAAQQPGNASTTPASINTATPGPEPALSNPTPVVTEPAPTQPPAAQPQIAGLPTPARSTTAPTPPTAGRPQSTTYLAVTNPITTIRTGSAAIGALLVLSAAILTVRKNRHILTATTPRLPLPPAEQHT